MIFGMGVAYCREAEDELNALPPKEHAAILVAIRKLRAVGDRLSHPLESEVRSS